jgi:hypothetical protein
MFIFVVVVRVVVSVVVDDFFHSRVEWQVAVFVEVVF